MDENLIQPVPGVRSRAIPHSPTPFAVQLGEWAFRQRSWLPVPFAVMLVSLRYERVHGTWPLAVGAALVFAGLCVRTWSVRHIGTISRTRSQRLGPLISSGPYALVRNPLYGGNFLLWTGFVLLSRLLWLLPIAWVAFAAQYGAIARWEHARLQAHFGKEYDEFAARVPAWWPRWGALDRSIAKAPRHPWSEVFFSERGTLAAAVLMIVLLVMSYLVWG